MMSQGLMHCLVLVPHHDTSSQFFFCLLPVLKELQFELTAQTRSSAQHYLQEGCKQRANHAVSLEFNKAFGCLMQPENRV